MHPVRQITVALASLSRARNECQGRTPAFSCLWRAYWPRAPKLPCPACSACSDCSARPIPCSHAPMLPCSHAPVHPCRTSHTAAASSPAPEHSPSPRPLVDSLSIAVHPASFNDQLSNIPCPSSSQPHPSRVQPRCRQPACHWPSCRFVRVSGAQRQRALMCASLHARATASLQRSPQASPYHRSSPISRHSLVTRRAPRPQEPTTLHAARCTLPPAPCAPKHKTPQSTPSPFSTPHHSYTSTPRKHRSPTGPAHGPLLTYRMTHAAPSSLVLHAPCSLCHAVMQPQPRDHHHDGDPRQPGFLRARATLSPVHSLSGYSLADPLVPSPTP
jgi:hypothetical protein